MKKITYLFLIAVLVFSLSACSFTVIFNDDSACSLISQLLEKEYRVISFDVNTVESGISLTSSFTVIDTTIYYSVERLGGLTLEGDEEFITEYKGEAFHENGVVTEINGDEVALPEYEVLIGGLDFDEEYFKNIIANEGSFSADVENLAGFFGADVEGEYGKVIVKYDLGGIDTIEISYQSSTSIVTMKYEFT